MNAKRVRRKVDRIPFRNRNQYGWWVASYIERFEYYDEPKHKLGRRCLAWENTILVKARNREEAYRKAVAVGGQCEGSEGWNSVGRKGAWRYEGLTMLLPIYEELEHGAEILWNEYAGRTVRSIRALVKSKRELTVFNDSEDPKPKRRRRSSGGGPRVRAGRPGARR